MVNFKGFFCHSTSKCVNISNTSSNLTMVFSNFLDPTLRWSGYNLVFHKIAELTRISKWNHGSWKEHILHFSIHVNLVSIISNDLLRTTKWRMISHYKWHPFQFTFFSFLSWLKLFSFFSFRYQSSALDNCASVVLIIFFLRACPTDS